MNINIKKQLDRVIAEDYIWIIYLFIIGFNLYSNHLEKKYLINKDLEARKQFRMINNFVLAVILLIYIYFVAINIDDYKNITPEASQTKKNLITLSLIASVLFFIGGAITLYVSLKSPSLDNEIAIT